MSNMWHTMHLILLSKHDCVHTNITLINTYDHQVCMLVEYVLMVCGEGIGSGIDRRVVYVRGDCGIATPGWQ